MKTNTIAFTLSALFFSFACAAQTDHDAIMMNKHQWCNGISYEHTQWKNYWEGTLKRDNQNIGAFTSQSVMFMSNYGISNNLNIMANVPYVTNKVSGGTLHSMKGLQDASMYIKWRPYTAKWGKSRLSLLAAAGAGTPLNKYTADFQPLSLGLGATSFTGRAIADYQLGKFFTTASAAYILRSDITISRNAYYTDHMIYSDKVAMPNAAVYMLSAGVRIKYLIAEAMLSNTTTLGGFDIRRNDMPFPSNRMNMTSAGIHAKYTLPFYTHIELTGDGSYVLKGRNVGQATMFGFGAYYLFTFKK